MHFTVFSYIYRDAANYKAFGEIWLLGAMSDEDRRTILSNLDSSEFFIAEQIGIPPLYRDLYKYSGGRTEDDHAWHMLENLRLEQTLPEGTDIWGNISTLVSAFSSVHRQWKPELSPNFVE